MEVELNSSSVRGTQGFFFFFPYLIKYKELQVEICSLPIREREPWKPHSKIEFHFYRLQHTKQTLNEKNNRISTLTMKEILL